MFKIDDGAFDEISQLQAEEQYKNDIGLHLITKELYGLQLEVLRYGVVMYHMGSDAGFRPKYRYYFTEASLAKALGCTTNRVHHAVLRLKKEKPRQALGAGWEDIAYDNVIYQDSLYINSHKLSNLLEDLAQRRPYLNTARLAYKMYLDNLGYYSKDQFYFGRQGILKANTASV